MVLLSLKARSIRHFVIFFVAVVTVLPKAQAQEVNPLEKVWILIQSRSIKDNKIVSNPITRLRFDDEKIYVTLDRSDNEMSQPYSVTGKELKGRYLAYTIESVTDSSLTLSIPQDQKMYFLAKGYSPCGESFAEKAGEYNGHPYYKGLGYLKPRYLGDPLLTLMNQAIHADRQKQKITVSFSFIVDEKGIMRDVKILKSYSNEIDTIILDILQKSSGKWQAPILCDMPVATGLSYAFEYDPEVHLAVLH